MAKLGISVAQLAELIGVSRQSVNELVHERRAVSSDMALRPAKLFGTSPQSWLNLQRNVHPAIRDLAPEHDSVVVSQRHVCPVLFNAVDPARQLLTQSEAVDVAVSPFRQRRLGCARG